MVISTPKCKYWVWSKDKVLTRYESGASLCGFHIHGCKVSTFELIPNKGWNDFQVDDPCLLWFMNHDFIVHENESNACLVSPWLIIL